MDVIASIRHTLPQLEASDGVSGGVRTELVDGFILDRGFQVLPTAYPEARLVQNYRALDLKPFYPEYLLHFDGRMHGWGIPSTMFPGG